MGVFSGCRGAGSQSRWRDVQVPVQGQRRAPASSHSCSRCGLWDGISRKPHSHGRCVTSSAVQQVKYLGDEEGPRSSASLSHTCWGIRSAVFVFRFCCSAAWASPERRKRAGCRAFSSGGRRPFSAVDGSLRSCHGQGLRANHVFCTHPRGLGLAARVTRRRARHVRYFGCLESVWFAFMACAIILTHGVRQSGGRESIRREKPPSFWTVIWHRGFPREQIFFFAYHQIWEIIWAWPCSECLPTLVPAQREVCGGGSQNRTTELNKCCLPFSAWRMAYNPPCDGFVLAFICKETK